MTTEHMAAPTVQADSFLTLHYRLSGASGDVINTFAGKPATLSLGTGELAPAVEAKLLLHRNPDEPTGEVPRVSAVPPDDSDDDPGTGDLSDLADLNDPPEPGTT